MPEAYSKRNQKNLVQNWWQYCQKKDFGLKYAPIASTVYHIFLWANLIVKSFLCHYFYIFLFHYSFI